MRASTLAHSPLALKTGSAIYAGLQRPGKTISGVSIHWKVRAFVATDNKPRHAGEPV